MSEDPPVKHHHSHCDGCPVLRPGDLVQLDAEAGFLVAIVRDVHVSGGLVRLTVSAVRPADEQVEVIL